MQTERRQSQGSPEYLWGIDDTSFVVCGKIFADEEAFSLAFGFAPNMRRSRRPSTTLPSPTTQHVRHYGEFYECLSYTRWPKKG